MIEKVFEFIISLFLKIVSTVAEVLMYSIWLVISGLFPDLDPMMTTLISFLELVVPFFSFVVTLIEKITLIPRSILLLYFGIFFARLSAKPVIFVFVKVKKMWAFIKGGKE